ncbi:MAG: lipoyl protein ligase domain-containing protein [Candidatus Heimdallarchaeaceae archaeon]
MRSCYLVEYNHLEYRYSLELQQRIRAIKEDNRDYDNFLLVLQHNPVFTIGKKGSRDDILATEEILTNEGIDVVEVRRGGEVTYHGPRRSNLSWSRTIGRIFFAKSCKITHQCR